MVEPTKKPWTERDIESGDLPAIYKALSEKFPHDTIQEAKTSWGTVLGVKSQFIINRLNEVLGINHWRYEIIDKEIQPQGRTNMAWVAVRLDIGNPTSEGFNVLASRTHFGGSGNPVLHESIKGAVTNAFKKAASMFGIAKEVYEGTLDEDFAQYSTQAAVPEATPVQATPTPVATTQSAGTDALEQQVVDLGSAPNVTVKATDDPQVQKFLTFFNTKITGKSEISIAEEVYERGKEKLTVRQRRQVEAALEGLKTKYA